MEYYCNISYSVEIRRNSSGEYTISHPELNGCSVSSDNICRGLILLESKKRQWIENAIKTGIEIPEI